MAEHLAVNEVVVGSNPTSGAKIKPRKIVVLFWPELVEEPFLNTHPVKLRLG